MSKETDKLAAEMKKLRPSKTSRAQGMDAAMKAFDDEFAAVDMKQAETADGSTAKDKNSHHIQGSADEPRLTSQTTHTKRGQSIGSSMMTKINSIFTFNPKTKMIMGSCAAALMASFIVFPVAMDSMTESQRTQKFENIASSMEPEETFNAGETKQTEVAPAPPKEEVREVIVTANQKDKSNNIASAPKDVGKNTAAQDAIAAPVQSQSGLNSVNDLLNKVKTNNQRQTVENLAREAEFKASRGQQSLALSDGPRSGITLDANSGNIVPVETKQVSRRRVKTPAGTVERIVPAVTKMQTRRVQNEDGTFKTIMETVVVQEASTELVQIPATYETVTETIVVSRNKFEDFKPNPVLSVSEKPVSTFSIDVDTASYSFLRSSINRGQLPRPSAIRLEEMINYFPYDYEAPRSADEPFKANVTVMPTPWNADTKLMHIGIKGYVPTVTEKPRSNIVFLIDTSGSMNADNKLPLLINSFKLLLGTLDADDTVSIVTYAGSAGTVLEPTAASDKSAINAALNRLRAGGSTAGAAGLELAYMKAQESFDDEGINRVILATDGDFNVGFSSPDEMKTFVEKKRKTGIFLSVLGFGNGNYNDHLMQSLAQNGNGVAAYIDSLAEANKVLADEAGSALITIAKDVKIQVEFNPSTISEYRLIGYETRALNREDFNNDAVDAGEINSGHTVTAIYELTPVGSSAQMVDNLRYVDDKPVTVSTGSDELAFVKIRHKLPNADKSTLQTFPVEADEEKSIARAGNDTRFAVAVAAVGQKLRGDTQLASYSYKDAIELAKSAKGEDENGYRSEFIQLVRLAESLQE